MAWFGENPDRAKKLEQLKLMMEELIGGETTLGDAEVAIVKEICFKQMSVSVYWMKRALKAEKVARALNAALLCRMN
jgi:stress response protein YsnF